MKQVTVNTKTTLRADGTYNYEDVVYSFYQAGKYRDWYCSYLSAKTGYTVTRKYKSEEAMNKAYNRMLKKAK